MTETELRNVSYHELFLYSREEVKAVRKCIKDGLWIGKTNGEIEFCLDLLRNLSYRLCKQHSIPQVEQIIYGHTDRYWHIRVIELENISIVSFLHEWRHHYQHMTGRRVGDEPDCKAYSLGLFRKACPTAFKNAWKNGRLEFMPPYPTKETRMALKEYDRVTEQMYEIDDDNEEVW